MLEGVLVYVAVGIAIFFCERHRRKKPNGEKFSAGAYHAAQMNKLANDQVTNPAYSSLSCNIHNTRD